MQKSEMKQFLEGLAEELRTVAKTSKEGVDRSWPSSSKSDREMRKMGSSDAKSIRELASLVKAGRITEAYNRASGLDTLVREMVPDRFWKFAEALRRLTAPAHP